IACSQSSRRDILPSQSTRLNSTSVSALGHKRTYAVQKGMSALPPIATAKADSRKRSCPLYSQKRTCALHSVMSAKGQKRTWRLILEPRQRARAPRAAWRGQSICRFEINHNFVLRRRLNRHLGRLIPLEDLIDVAGRLPVLIEKIRSIRDEATIVDEEAIGVDGG